MKKLSYLLSGFAFLVLLSAATFPESEGSLNHLVFFKYKEGATPEQIASLTREFATLKGRVPEVLSFEAGLNNSPEKLNKGFTHLYRLTFKDEAARNAYLVHPEHKKFGTFAGELGIIAEVFVFDYSE